MKRIERSLKLFFMTELKLKEVENYSVFLHLMRQNLNLLDLTLLLSGCKYLCESATSLGIVKHAVFSVSLLYFSPV